MELLQLGVTLKTLSPLHHGFTAPKELGEGKDKKTMRYVRQVDVLLPSNNGTNEWRKVSVPVLGGNAIRGRLRRVAADITFTALGVTPQDFTADAKAVFHTLTSGGTLTGKPSEKDSKSKSTKESDEKSKPKSTKWASDPSYRRDRVAEWPILSLFGFSFADFMTASKLRVHFGWPLIHAIKNAVAIEGVDEVLFPEGDWVDISASEIIKGNLFSPEGQQEAHYEYRHADDDLVPMPEKNTDKDEAKKNELSGMVIAYQYVPVGVPFGIRLFGTDLTPLEQSLLRATLDHAFPADQPFLFGARNTSGMGVFRTQRHVGLDSMPPADLYLEYLANHRERLLDQMLHTDKFLHDGSIQKDNSDTKGDAS